MTKKQKNSSNQQKNAQEALIFESLNIFLEKEKQILKSIILDKIKYLDKFPEGSLQTRHSRNHFEYYHCPGAPTKAATKSGEIKYIPISNTSFIKQLAQKDYDLQVLNRAKKLLSKIEKFQKAEEKLSLNHIFYSLPPAKQCMTTPITSPFDQYANEWESFAYPTRVFSTDDPEHYTARGERVQSKSERIIADTLFKEGIPYRYECPLYIQSINKTFHPDFMVMNKRTRQVFLWEHLGKMDDPSYVSTNMDRIRHYESAGYYPGINLILTFEDKKAMPSQKLIDSTIKHYLT